MKLRQVMLVDPMRSTITPKNGTERPMRRSKAITRERKRIRFHPKSAELFVSKYYKCFAYL